VSRPVVGICTAVEEASWGGWAVVCNLSPRSYTLTVQAAGGMALLLPPDDAAAEQPSEMLDRVDGLMLAGGSDVDPASYGAQPHPQTRGSWPERDRFELALGHRALERDLPLLGICRGMQMLNVVSGGTLEQHLPEQTGGENHRHTPGVFSDHAVRLAPKSLAARVVGSSRSAVKSHHHQGVAELGEGVEASGWSEDDEVIEAIELPGQRFAVGVLWHPEVDEHSGVVAALVEEARGRR
jgi:putative glutamine amidotransferase